MKTFSILLLFIFLAKVQVYAKKPDNNSTAVNCQCASGENSILINGSFEKTSNSTYNSVYDLIEDLGKNNNGVKFLDRHTDTDFPGWFTTGGIALQQGGFSQGGTIEVGQSGFLGFEAPDGSVYAEMDGNHHNQIISVTPGQLLDWELSHRGREGLDEISVSAGPVGNQSVIANLSSPNTAWTTHTGQYEVPAGVTEIQFSITPTGASNGDIDSSNLIDNVKLCPADKGNTETPSEHIAIGKITAQSSTAHNGASARAVDGNTSGTYKNGSVTHTSNETNSWWRVDLGDVYDLSTIKVHNRTDCCTERINEASLYVGTINNTNPNDYTLVGALSNITINPFTNLNILARYVMVQHAGKGTLSLAEVEVHGTLNTDNGGTTNNVAKSKPTSQSSTAHGGASSRAVDANTSGTWSKGSVTHTKNQANSWWRVDLEGTYDLSSIKIHNRTGCCTNRIIGASLYAGNTNSSNPNDYTLLGALSDITINSFTNMNISARYVMVRHAGKGTLSLAEVEVFGKLEAKLGVNTIKAGISPNPAQNYLNIDLQNYDNQNVEYWISSIQGQTISRGKIAADYKKTVQIDISTLQNGIYLIYLQSDNKHTAAQRIVVMRD